MHFILGFFTDNIPNWTFVLSQFVLKYDLTQNSFNKASFLYFFKIILEAFIEKINAYLSAVGQKNKKQKTTKKKDTPLFISLKTFVQKWYWYQSSWIIVYFKFDALKFFLGVRLHGGSQPNFNFLNVNPQIFLRNRKVHLSNCLETNFHDISIISLRVIRRRNYS